MSEWQELQVKDLIQQGIIEKPLDGNHGEIHPKGEDFVASGIPFVMASDINEGKVDLEIVYPFELATANMIYPFPGWN